jgi:hypothetical protein
MYMYLLVDKLLDDECGDEVSLLCNSLYYYVVLRSNCT